MQNSKSIPPFVKGQKVICVDAGYMENSMSIGGPARELVKDKIYTVQEVIPPIFNEYGVVVEETKSSHPTGAFLHTRFAPITPKFETIEYKEVLEKEKEFVGSN